MTSLRGDHFICYVKFIEGMSLQGGGRVVANGPKFISKLPRLGATRSASNSIGHRRVYAALPSRLVGVFRPRNQKQPNSEETHTKI